MKSDPSLGAEFWRPKLKELVFTKTINGVKDNDEELAIIDLDGKTRFWLFDATGDENNWFIKKAASGLPLVSIVQKVTRMSFVALNPS